MSNKSIQENLTETLQTERNLLIGSLSLNYVCNSTCNRNILRDVNYSTKGSRDERWKDESFLQKDVDPFYYRHTYLLFLSSILFKVYHTAMNLLILASMGT